jgi:outer membrane usher protein FimD/PapC
LIAPNDLPDLAYAYDEPRQRLQITVDERQRLPKRYNVSDQSNPSIEAQSGYGAVLNYTLFASSVENASPWKLA